jgi:hypothetical protein
MSEQSKRRSIGEAVYLLAQEAGAMFARIDAVDQVWDRLSPEELHEFTKRLWEHQASARWIAKQVAEALEPERAAALEQQYWNAVELDDATFEALRAFSEDRPEDTEPPDQ